MLLTNDKSFTGLGYCRSAKAGYYASRYKKFGNLCYVIGALRAFMGHKNVDLRIKVSCITGKSYYFIHLIKEMNIQALLKSCYWT